MRTIRTPELTHIGQGPYDSRKSKLTNLVDLAGDETIRVGLTDRYDAAGAVVLLGIGLEVPEVF